MCTFLLIWFPVNSFSKKNKTLESNLYLVITSFSCKCRCICAFLKVIWRESGSSCSWWDERRAFSPTGHQTSEPGLNPAPLREMLLVVLYKIKVVQTSGHCLSPARKKTVAVWTSTAWKEFHFNGYRRLYSYTLTSSLSELHLPVDKPQQRLMRSHLWCIHLFFSSFCPPPQPYTLSARPLPSRP